MQEEGKLSENITESTLVEPSQNGQLEEGAQFLSDCEESPLLNEALKLAVSSR